MMKVNYFINQLKKAEKSKTLYVMGCFGAPMNSSNKTRYKNNNSYNKNPTRQKMIEKATNDTFGFDCVCLIKGILWGWDANKLKTYGGAIYQKDNIPDYDAKQFFNLCRNKSSVFDNIIPGAMVWMEGHCGVYVGEGKVIESTPKWNNCVQYSNLGNIGLQTGNFRNWTKWGLIPFVDYSEEDDNMTPKIYNKIEQIPSYYKESIAFFINRGYINGTGGNNLNLTEDMCRILTIIYRMVKDNDKD